MCSSDLDVHGAVAAVDAGNGVVGQALFVKTVGHVDKPALIFVISRLVPTAGVVPDGPCTA